MKALISSKVISMCACTMIVTVGCVSVPGEVNPRTSLFGGSNRPVRSMPLPAPEQASSQLPSLNPKSNQLMENSTPSGTLLPQLNGALAGNAGPNSGIAQPMFASPLLFQRLDRNTWRVAASAPLLFKTVARILSQTYIIARSDRQTLSLSTEWDKFFVDGRLFRNRVSINIFALNQRNSDLVIKNNIEYYTQTASKTDENDPTQWLPTHDVTDELDRILEKTQRQLMAQMSANPLR